MFNYNQIKQAHIEITNNCQASCPMCSRNINGGLPNPKVRLHDWSLDDFKIIMNPQFLQQLDHYYFCGCFGDAILNDDLLDMCRYSVDIAPNTNFSIHTNGSARKISWWETLAQILGFSHKVVFALDGLEDTHHLHRIGTNYHQILKNASAFIAKGGNAEWAFIRFQHNEHQVDAARKLSQDLGFTSFTVKDSIRFTPDERRSVVDRQGNVLYFIEPPKSNKVKLIDRDLATKYKEIVQQSTINCRAKKDREIYIDAFGDFYPCCWMGSILYNHIPDDFLKTPRQESTEQIKKFLQQIGDTNLLRRPLEEIIESSEFQTIWESAWNRDKYIICASTCGSNKQNTYSKNDDQFIESVQFDKSLEPGFNNFANTK